METTAPTTTTTTCTTSAGVRRSYVEVSRPGPAHPPDPGPRRLVVEVPSTTGVRQVHQLPAGQEGPQLRSLTSLQGRRSPPLRRHLLPNVEPTSGDTLQVQGRTSSPIAVNQPSSSSHATSSSSRSISNTAPGGPPGRLPLPANLPRQSTARQEEAPALDRQEALHRAQQRQHLPQEVLAREQIETNKNFDQHLEEPERDLVREKIETNKNLHQHFEENKGKLQERPERDPVREKTDNYLRDLERDQPPKNLDENLYYQERPERDQTREHNENQFQQENPECRNLQAVNSQQFPAVFTSPYDCMQDAHESGSSSSRSSGKTILPNFDDIAGRQNRITYLLNPASKMINLRPRAISQDRSAGPGRYNISDEQMTPAQREYAAKCRSASADRNYSNSNYGSADMPNWRDQSSINISSNNSINRLGPIRKNPIRTSNRFDKNGQPLFDIRGRRFQTYENEPAISPLPEIPPFDSSRNVLSLPQNAEASFLNDLVIQKNTKTPLLPHLPYSNEQQQKFLSPNALKIGEQQDTFMLSAKNIEQQTSDTNSKLINFTFLNRNESTAEATFVPNLKTVNAENESPATFGSNAFATSAVSPATFGSNTFATSAVNSATFGSNTFATSQVNVPISNTKICSRTLAPSSNAANESSRTNVANESSATFATPDYSAEPKNVLDVSGINFNNLVTLTPNDVSSNSAYQPHMYEVAATAYVHKASEPSSSPLQQQPLANPDNGMTPLALAPATASSATISRPAENNIRMRLNVDNIRKISFPNSNMRTFISSNDSYENAKNTRKLIHPDPYMNQDIFSMHSSDACSECFNETFDYNCSTCNNMADRSRIGNSEKMLPIRMPIMPSQNRNSSEGAIPKIRKIDRGGNSQERRTQNNVNRGGDSQERRAQEPELPASWYPRDIPDEMPPAERPPTPVLSGPQEKADRREFKMVSTEDQSYAHVGVSLQPASTLARMPYTEMDSTTVARASEEKADRRKFKMIGTQNKHYSHVEVSHQPVQPQAGADTSSPLQPELQEPSQDTRWEFYKEPPQQSRGGYARPPPPWTPCPTCQGYPSPTGCPSCRMHGAPTSGPQGPAPTARDTRCFTCNGFPPLEGCYNCSYYGTPSSSGRQGQDGNQHPSAGNHYQHFNNYNDHSQGPLPSSGASGTNATHSNHPGNNYNDHQGPQPSSGAPGIHATHSNHPGANYNAHSQGPQPPSGGPGIDANQSTYSGTHYNAPTQGSQPPSGGAGNNAPPGYNTDGNYNTGNISSGAHNPNAHQFTGTNTASGGAPPTATNANTNHHHNYHTTGSSGRPYPDATYYNTGNAQSNQYNSHSTPGATSNPNPTSGNSGNNYDNHSQGFPGTSGGANTNNTSGFAGSSDQSQQHHQGWSNNAQGNGNDYNSGQERARDPKSSAPGPPSGPPPPGPNAPCPTCRGSPPSTGCRTCGRRGPSQGASASAPCPQCHDRPPPNGCPLCGLTPCPTCAGHPTLQGCPTCLQRACAQCFGRPPFFGCLTCAKYPCAVCKDRPPFPQCRTCGRKTLGPPPPPPCLGCMGGIPPRGCPFCRRMPTNGPPPPPCPTCRGVPPPLGCPTCFMGTPTPSVAPPRATSAPTQSPQQPPIPATHTQWNSPAPAPSHHNQPPLPTPGTSVHSVHTNSGRPLLEALTEKQLNEYADLNLAQLSVEDKGLVEARRLISQRRNDRHHNYLQWKHLTDMENEFTVTPPHIIDAQQAFYDNVVRFDKQLKTLQKQLIEMDTSKTKYNLGITLPPDTGVDKDINAKYVRSTIPEFHENHPHLNLYDYLHKLMHHARLEHWSHANIKDGIGLTTMGEPYRAWEANQDRPLADIIKAMENEFSKGGGMNRNKQDARNFERHEGEELRACVTRFQRVLRKTDYKTPGPKAQIREELRLEQMITTVCSPSALIKIEEARIEADQNGVELGWEQIFKIAEYQETLHQDLPREPRRVNMPFTTDKPVRDKSPGPDRVTFGTGAPRWRSGSPYERPTTPGATKPTTPGAPILPKAPNDPAPAAPQQPQRLPQQQPQQQQADPNANQGGQQGGQGRPSRNRFRNNNTFGNNTNNANQRNPNNPNFQGNQNQQQPTGMDIDVDQPRLTIPYSQPQQNTGYQQPQLNQNNAPQYSAPRPTYSAVVPQQYQQPQQPMPQPVYQPPQVAQQYQQPPQQQLPWNQQPQVLYGQPPQQPPQGQWPRQQQQQFQQGGRRGNRNNNNANQRNPNNPNFTGNQNWKPQPAQFQVQPSMNVDPNQPGYPTMTANYFPTGTFNQDIRLNMQAMGEAINDCLQMDIQMKDQNQRRSSSPDNQRRGSSKGPLALLGPGQVYVPPPDPNLNPAATCYGCGKSHQHDFSLCYKTIYGNKSRATSPPRNATPPPFTTTPFPGRPPPVNQNGPPQPPRLCPHCHSAERHTYRLCAMNPNVIARNQGKVQG